MRYALHQAVSREWQPLASAVALLVLMASSVGAQNDPEFSPRVARPAFQHDGPRVLIDEGHANPFTKSSGRGLPLIALLEADGYRVGTYAGTLVGPVLEDVAVLIIAAARGADPSAIQSNGGSRPDSAMHMPAFTSEENDAIERWVRGGGALLLASEHYPYGRSMASLAARFNVTIQDGYLADTANLARFALPDSVDAGSTDESNVVLSRAGGLLRDHPITRGRDQSERIDRVVLGGTSLCGPSQSSTVFAISPTAQQRIARNTPGTNPQLGCAQGIAFSHGRGRVVVLGDANWFVTAQARQFGAKRVKVGLSMTEAENRQFTLNTMHWLSRVLR